MARGKTFKKRAINPDPKYNDQLVAKFINYIMENGKKSLARKIVYQAFDEIENLSKKPGLEVFHKALENTGPVLEVRSKRVGGANYQVPVEVSRERRATLAMRWIIEAANNRGGKDFSKLISLELIDAASSSGGAVKKKEDTHRMAEANRAFAHFARM